MNDSFIIDEKTLDSIIGGVLFDFMGWLTTRDGVLSLGGNENCSPAAEVIEQFCKMRNVSMSNANVENWENYKEDVDENGYPLRLKEIDKNDLKNKWGSIV